MTICCCASFTLILSACAQVVYYDGQFDDARLNVALACTAASIGAAVVNHTKCTKLLKVCRPAAVEMGIFNATMRAHFTLA